MELGRPVLGAPATKREVLRAARAGVNQCIGRANGLMALGGTSVGGR